MNVARVEELTLENRQVMLGSSMFHCLTLYAPCIILQYVYEPTRCTKFFVIRLSFLLGALHVSDCISPSSGATFISCTSHLVYADTCVCCVAIAAQQTHVWYRHIPAYTKCDVQFIEVAPDDGLI